MYHDMLPLSTFVFSQINNAGDTVVFFFSALNITFFVTSFEVVHENKTLLPFAKSVAPD